MTPEQTTFTSIRPPVRLQKYPLETLGKCSEAALEADWTYRQWKEFRKAAVKWLTPEADDESDARFENVVRGYFAVKTFKAQDTAPDSPT